MTKAERKKMLAEKLETMQQYERQLRADGCILYGGVEKSEEDLWRDLS